MNCEEVMEDFSVSSSEPVYVIEAFLSSNTDSIYVFISQTADYLNPISYPKISNANILLSYNDTTIVVIEESPGIYTASAVFSTKTNYSLSVQIQDEVFTAHSYLPEPVGIDSTMISVFPYSAFIAEYPGQLFYEITLYFKDPAQERNFYRIKITENDTLLNSPADLYIFDDKLLNGLPLDLLLRGYYFEEGDTIHIEFLSIDEANYVYYRGLREAMTSTGNFSIPDNPKTNFSPFVLGHFLTYSSDTVTLIIPNLDNIP